MFIFLLYLFISPTMASSLNGEWKGSGSVKVGHEVVACEDARIKLEVADKLVTVSARVLCGAKNIEWDPTSYEIENGFLFQIEDGKRVSAGTITSGLLHYVHHDDPFQAQFQITESGRMSTIASWGDEPILMLDLYRFLP